MVQIVAGLDTAANIVAGTNSGTFTSGTASLGMAWRTRTLAETGIGGSDEPGIPSDAGCCIRHLLSDVLQLTGMGNGSADPSQADPFALQLTYHAATLDNEVARAANGEIYLGWLNSNGQPLWQNAILGDFGTDATAAEMNSQGSFATFESEVGDSNLADYIGAWGVDTADHEVWAVLNHDGEFAVVPEPGTMHLALFGVAGLVVHRCQRKSPDLISGNGRCRQSDHVGFSHPAIGAVAHGIIQPTGPPPSAIINRRDDYDGHDGVESHVVRQRRGECVLDDRFPL